MTRQGRETTLRYLIIGIATLAVVFWLSTVGQPLIDQHEFRQTQTALTALFMGPSLNGLLSYETPVLGSPWSIPFEFPLYQWLASLLSRLLPIPLSASGRLVSVVFGLGCLWAALEILRRFKISTTGRSIFCLLYLTSAIYLYWNRSFMIESTALFFALTSLLLYCSLRDPDSRRSNQTLAQLYGQHAAFMAALSLGLLIKATTSIPVFLLISIDLVARSGQLAFHPSELRKQWIGLLSIAITLTVAFLLLRAWTDHTDALKLLNPIGKSFTSQKLQPWNFGTLQQRFSTELWNGVLIQRMLTPWGTLPAAGLLVLGLLSRSTSTQPKILIWGCLSLAIAPLLIFTNLHIVHDYYQSANQIYLLMALACSASLVLESNHRAAIKIATYALAFWLMAASLHSFLTTSAYYRDALSSESIKLKIGSLIQKRTPVDSVLLVFDDDWSSAFGFHARRRSLAVPDGFKADANRSDFLRRGAHWLGGYPLAGVISKAPLSEDEQQVLSNLCGAPTNLRFPDWNVYLCPAR